MRESPAVGIVKALAQVLDGRLLVVEPYVEQLPKELAGHKNVVLADLDAALIKADIVLLLTDHRPFKEIPRERLNGKIVVDTRGAWR